MGLNRMMFIKKTTSGNAFVMTMGQRNYRYGFSRYNYGKVEGNVQYDGKAVTLVMLRYYGGYLEFAFNVEGVTGGRCNVTVKMTSLETNTSVTIEYPDIPYQSQVPGFYEYKNNLPAEVANMFNGKNVGKKYRVEIVFN